MRSSSFGSRSRSAMNSGPPASSTATSRRAGTSPTRQLRKAASASGGPSLGVRFRGIWADDDSTRPKRRAAWDAAPEPEPSDVVMPPTPCQRQVTDAGESELLMALEISKRGFREAQAAAARDFRPNIRQPRRATKGVLRNKGEIILHTAKHPPANATNNYNGPLASRLSVSRSASLPTLLKKETDSAHTRKRWDDPSHPQTKNVLLPLQMPSRKTSKAGEESAHSRRRNRSDTSDSTVSIGPMAPAKRMDSWSEASSIDDDHPPNDEDEEASIASGGLLTMPSPSKSCSLLEDNDEHDLQYSLQTTIVQSAMGKDAMMQHYYYNGGKSGNSDSHVIDHATKDQCPRPGLRFRNSDSTGLRNLPTTRLATMERWNPQLEHPMSPPISKQTTVAQSSAAALSPLIPSPPRRVASPLVPKTRRKSQSAPHLKPIQIHTRQNYISPNGSTGDVTAKTDDTVSLSSAEQEADGDELLKKLAQQSLEIAQQRRLDSRTYTEPLELLMAKDSKSSKQEHPAKACYYVHDCSSTEGDDEATQQKLQLEDHDEDDEALALVMYADSVGRYYEELVATRRSSKVSSDDFWRRYFFRCSEKRILKTLRYKAAAKQPGSQVSMDESS